VAARQGFPAIRQQENKLALAVIQAGKLLGQRKVSADGESPILILEYDRATRANPRQEDYELRSKRGKRRKGEKFPPGSKGDVNSPGTEVAATRPTDGRTYHGKIARD